jgi:hypothetical protein
LNTGTRIVVVWPDKVYCVISNIGIQPLSRTSRQVVNQFCEEQGATGENQNDFSGCSQSLTFDVKSQ